MRLLAPCLALAACTPAAPWIDVRGAAECVHQIARDPAQEAPPMRWEPGCPGDEIPGCERLLVTAGDGRLDGVNIAGEPAMVLDIYGSDQSTVAYYDIDARPLLMLRTTHGTADCRAQLAFGGGRAALLSTGGISLDYAPALLSAPFPGTAGWRDATPSYGERRILDAVFTPLADGRVALVHSDYPEAFIVGPDRWDALLREKIDVTDAAIVGEQVALLTATGELHVLALTGGPPTIHDPPGREIGATRSDGERLYWLELPDEADASAPLTIVDVELRASPIRAGEPLAPRVLARFPHRRYSHFFNGVRAFGGSFHAANLPHIGIGSGGVYVHVGRDAEDLLLLVRPTDGQTWAWTIGDGRRVPGLGPADSETRPDEKPHVPEFRSVTFISEQWLALSYAPGFADVRRYPLAGFQTPAAALTP